MAMYFRDDRPSIYTRIKYNAIEIAELVVFLAILFAGTYEVVKHALPFIHWAW